MFRGDTLIKPNNKAIVASLCCAVLIYFAANWSPVIGYLLAMTTLVALIASAFGVRIWPTKSKPVNLIFFASFWGLILGLVMPYLVASTLNGTLLDLLFD